MRLTNYRMPKPRPAHWFTGLTGLTVAAAGVLALVFTVGADPQLPPFATVTPIPTETPTPIPVLMTMLEPCAQAISGHICVVDLPSCQSPGILQSPGVICRWPIQAAVDR